MAAEASRSTGSADSYIGSLISLTSKSEIRYEGILFNINTEEASIGLRNVRSFGTEGRRKDGQQVPASDKVYEYIVFRGSDIKDLQVKSSPPSQTASSVHNDPAIIQSHYAAPSASSSLPSASASSAASAGSTPDFSSQVLHPGVPRPTYQNNIPLYQPGGALPSWNPSTPPSPNLSGVSVPIYWHGYYGPTGALQTQQQSLVRPVQGLSMTQSVQLPSAQQPGQYPPMNSSTPAGASVVSTSVELPSQLLHPIVSSTGSVQSTMLPVQSSPLIPDSVDVMQAKAPSQTGPAASLNSTLPLASSALPNALDKSTIASVVPNQGKPLSGPSMPLSSLSEPLPAVGITSSSPALVTPGQLLQPGLTTSLIPQTAQKDVEVVQVASSVSLSQAPVLASPAAKPVPSESQAPLLPLPSSANPTINGVSSHTRYTNRGGRGGRGNEFARPVADFTEDFDFEAMNEKFKKEEVWGHLGKNKAKADDGIDSEDEDVVDVQDIDAKPVYKKDDFFDTLSCNALDRESRNGRPWFSEQMRLDTETFGDFPRNRGYRGGRGPGRGGRSRGGYYGRGYGYGYGYGGRGRGNNMYRAI